MIFIWVEQETTAAVVYHHLGNQAQATVTFIITFDLAKSLYFRRCCRSPTSVRGFRIMSTCVKGKKSYPHRIVRERLGFRREGMKG